MLAIIETGGKQYKVKEGSILNIEKLDTEIASAFSFDKILLVENEGAIHIGQPYVSGATVEATVLNQIKDKKIIVFKFKRKTGYKKKQGHRQRLTTVKINKIALAA